SRSSTCGVKNHLVLILRKKNKLRKYRELKIPQTTKKISEWGEKNDSLNKQPRPKGAGYQTRSFAMKTAGAPCCLRIKRLEKSYTGQTPNSVPTALNRKGDIYFLRPPP
ncbi:MAG: hypothetical protein D3908_05775, partial [Candidatus Electrothrix sp. AUS4]|nr:hypothetical protein [Candidatus Electrothrix sp. AUS4]